MSGDLKTYIVSGKIVLSTQTLTVIKATVKNCYTNLQAKVKFEEACKQKYAKFVRCEISACYVDWKNTSLGDILGDFGFPFTK